MVFIINMGRFSKFPIYLATIVFLLFLFICQELAAQQWRPVRGGIAFGISGIALVEQQPKSLDLLIVHDNKEKNQNRLAIITIERNNQPQYLPLQWPNNIDLPIDLEALTVVPGQRNSSFMALNSNGKIYHLTLDKVANKIAILKVFNLPSITPGSNFEGFGLQEVDNKLLAVWADRGEGEDPAKIYWGTLDLSNYKIAPKGAAILQVPWPNSPQVRHISDLKVDKAGVLFISSATDAGNDGPFNSAIYVAGTFNVCGNKIGFRKNPELVSLARYDYHKIEGIELVPGVSGGLIVGTDDENMGSSIYISD